MEHSALPRWYMTTQPHPLTVLTTLLLNLPVSLPITTTASQPEIKHKTSYPLTAPIQLLERSIQRVTGRNASTNIIWGTVVMIQQLKFWANDITWVHFSKVFEICQKRISCCNLANSLQSTPRSKSTPSDQVQPFFLLFFVCLFYRDKDWLPLPSSSGNQRRINLSEDKTIHVVTLFTYSHATFQDLRLESYLSLRMTVKLPWHWPMHIGTLNPFLFTVLLVGWDVWFCFCFFLFLLTFCMFLQSLDFYSSKWVLTSSRVMACIKFSVDLNFYTTLKAHQKDICQPVKQNRKAV